MTLSTAIQLGLWTAAVVVILHDEWARYKDGMRQHLEREAERMQRAQARLEEYADDFD